MKPLRSRFGYDPDTKRALVAVNEGLKHRGLSGDHVRERQRYLEFLEKVALDHQGVPVMPLVDQGGELVERSLQSTLERGWYFGQEQFREQLLKRLKTHEEKTLSNHGDQARDYGQTDALMIKRRGLEFYGITEAELNDLKKSDSRKVVIGQMIRKRTSMQVKWIANELSLGVATSAANLLRRPLSQQEEIDL